MKLIKTATVCLLLLVFADALFAQAKKTTVKSKSASAAPSAASMAAGKKVYSTICISCHQADGGGVPNMNPPLIKTTYVLGNKSKLISILLNGFNENVEINGNTYSNTMPSQDFLKDQEIADVLTYVRNSFGNKASAVTVAEVKKGRAAKK
ncbi:MAG: cytochrome c [Mucilaginibacter sp.]|nr:cytochrome c [Mucilaginibacter sp.]